MKPGAVNDAPEWLALLSPLPQGTIPERKQLVTLDAVNADNAAIAGWEQLSMLLSAGTAGLRMIMVVLDGSGHLLSASDHVLHRFAQTEGEGVDMRQESIGGSFAPDGAFRGTCWVVEGPEPEGDEEPDWQSTPRPPSDGETEKLRALVVEMVRRDAARGPS